MSTSDDVGEFVSENSELLGRVLACGNDEARAYALALVANSGEPERSTRCRVNWNGSVVRWNRKAARER